VIPVNLMTTGYWIGFNYITVASRNATRIVINRM